MKLSAVHGGGGVDDGEPTSLLGQHHDGDGTSGTSSPDSCRDAVVAADTEPATHRVQRDQQMPPAAAAAETSHDVVVTPLDLLAGTPTTL